MTHRPKPTIRRLLRAIWDFKITQGGKLTFAVIVLTAVTGMLTLSSPIYHVFVALTCLALVAETAGLMFWPRCNLSGDLPDKVVAERPVTVEYTLTNRSRLPAYDVSVGFFDLPRAWRAVAPARPVARLAPRGSARAAVELLPLRRGVYEFEGPRVFTSFPFNLFRSGPWPRRTCRVTVLPSFQPISLTHLGVRRRYQPGGITLTSNVGESPEFIGNRMYRPGDSTRRIDFRSWARLAEPVVREFQEEYFCRVGLVLDTYVPRLRWPAPSGFADLEAAVSLAAAVADALSTGEFILDLFAAGPELYVFRSGRHTAHLENVLEILACVQASRKNPFAVVAPALADELDGLSSVLCILLDWDADRRDLVRRAVESGCGVRVIVVRPGATRLPVADDEGWAGPITHLRPRDVRRGEVTLA